MSPWISRFAPAGADAIEGMLRGGSDVDGHNQSGVR